MSAAAPEGVTQRRFAVCWSGGSGIVYGLRLVEVLLQQRHLVHLCASGAAARVLVHEAGAALDLAAPDYASLFAAGLRQHLRVHDIAAVEAAPASGSAQIEATVIVPCSMGTLARVAHGFSSNLVERAADVALKERRPLIVVPREAPLSVLHLRNMLQLAELGATILPAMPGFYHRPRSVAELVDFVVGKILDKLAVPHALVQRWDTPPSRSPWDEGEE